MKSVLQSQITRSVLLFLVLFALVSGTVFGAAVDYPTRPVTINIGYAPGAAASVGATIFAEAIQKYLEKPQPFLVNSKPGASGMVAVDYFMKQPADGYNLMWAAIESVTRMALEPQKFHFTIEDFVYIGAFTYSPYILAVSVDSPFKTFEDFVDYAKKNPDVLTYSTSGVASMGHQTGEMLMKEMGIKLTHVPFAAGTPAALAVLGNHVSCTLSSLGTMSSYLKAGGKARGLAVFDGIRFTDLPNVPTAKERGCNVSTATYHFIAVKKGTPQPVIDMLRKVFSQAASEPGVKSTLFKAGLLALNLGPVETEKKVKQDFVLGKEIFGKLGVVVK
jgi:tripartite-type tricarboxylate transporter receptor subunit TctC